MKKTIRIICLILAVSALGLAMMSCKNDKAFYNHKKSKTGKGINIVMSEVQKEINSMNVEDFVPTETQGDYVLIKIKNYGSIVVLLREDVAPATVKHFRKLVGEKFFDGTVFHRVIKDFMIQGGGCIIVTSKDGKTETFEAKEASSTIKGEFTSNGFKNNLKHVRGVIAMARTTTDPDSASSQFYIVHQTNESSHNLDGDYATFGYVLAGMDVVDAIANCKVFGDEDAPIPLENVVIESITFVQPK